MLFTLVWPRGLCDVRLTEGISQINHSSSAVAWASETSTAKNLLLEILSWPLYSALSMDAWNPFRAIPRDHKYGRDREEVWGRGKRTIRHFLFLRKIITVDAQMEKANGYFFPLWFCIVKWGCPEPNLILPAFPNRLCTRVLELEVPEKPKRVRHPLPIEF